MVQGTATVVTQFWKTDSPDSYLTDQALKLKNDGNLVSMPGFRALNYTRAWRKFYSFKSLTKSQNCPW
jgi:hypothetical protein